MFCVSICKIAIVYNPMTFLLNQTDNTHRVRVYSWLLILSIMFAFNLALLHFKSIPWDQHWCPHLIISIGIGNADWIWKYLKERMLQTMYLFIHFVMKILSVLKKCLVALLLIHSLFYLASFSCKATALKYHRVLDQYCNWMTSNLLSTRKTALSDKVRLSTK